MITNVVTTNVSPHLRGGWQTGHTLFDVDAETPDGTLLIHWVDAEPGEAEWTCESPDLMADAVRRIVLPKNTPAEAWAILEESGRMVSIWMTEFEALGHASRLTAAAAPGNDRVAVVRYVRDDSAPTWVGGTTTSRGE